MSLRYLYRRPGVERICPGCGRVIERNIALRVDEPWHYGCLQEAKRLRYRCLGCGAELRGLETTESLVLDRRIRGCGLCGSTLLTSLFPPHPFVEFSQVAVR